MKRRMWITTAASLACGISVSALHAEEPEAGKPIQRSMAPRPGRERGRDPLRMELRFNGQLRDAAIAELELAEPHKANVSRLFQEHLEAIQALARAPREDAAESDAESRIEELERQAQAAREAGDREAFRRLRQEIQELRSGDKGRHREEMQRLNQQLIENVKSELTEEQTAKFDEIIQRVRAQNEGGDSIMRLMQAGRKASAKLDLDDEQRRRVNEIVRNAARSSMREGGQPQTPEAAMETLRTDIITALGPELGEQFMQALQEEQTAMANREARGPGPRNKPHEDAPQPNEEEREESPDKDEE